MSAVDESDNSASRLADPSTSSRDDGKSSLDSLLSPPPSTLATPISTRNSLSIQDRDSDSFNEVALGDEEAFPMTSTIALSARERVQSISSVRSFLPSGQTQAHASREPENRADVTEQQPGDPTSIPSSPPIGNIPFMLAQLDSPKHRSDFDQVNGHNRAVLDGQQKLQEEFVRTQKQRQEEVDNSGSAGIDWDFWGAVVSDYSAFAAEHGERLARAIEKGIPDALRGMMWQLMAASKNVELEAQYLKLLKEVSPHEKAIMRDLGRTFPHHEFFTDGDGIGQENLFNVLRAYSLHDPQVGYCQGLPFVVAILLLNMPDEEAFSLLVRLMYSYDLRGHFLPEMPRLQLRLFQFERLTEELLPVLHVHFLRQGVKSSMFCSQWFLTLFSYRFPLEIVFRIYDNCLASGIEAIFAFAIALLQQNEDALLGLKFDELMPFFTNNLLDRYKIEPDADGAVQYRVGDFVEDAFAVKITPFMLDTFAHEYEEIVRVRDAHAIELEGLRKANRAWSTQVKMLESSLAQLNVEHVEILNELVRARLRNEEMEGELVRYKLLYAEAMHENQDARSSHRVSANLLAGATSGSGQRRSPGRGP